MYQGESNSDRAYQYRKLFPALISNWRGQWHVVLPFYFVQIAPHKDKIPEIREAQLFTYRNVPHTGMVVITDFGDSTDIHPRNKTVVGERLALWALAHEYGKKLEYSGPLYKMYKVEGSNIRIYFDHAEGLNASGALQEFSIASADKNFKPATAAIEGNTVVVHNNEVMHPVAVRFAWKSFPRPNLFNGSGLPASPFRTDDWPGETIDKK